MQQLSKKILIPFMAVFVASMSLGFTWIMGPGKGNYAAAAGGPPVFDAASSATAVLSGTSISWSHTCTGSNRIVIIFIAEGENSPNSWQDPTAVTYGGNAMTEVTGYLSSDAAFCHQKAYYLIAPPTGAQTVSVTWSVTMDEISGGAISFTAAHQSVPFGTAATATGNSATASVVVTSGTAEIVVCSTYNDCDTTIAVGTGTSRFEVEAILNDTCHGGSTAPGAASVTPTWTLAVSNPWVISAVSVKGL